VVRPLGQDTNNFHPPTKRRVAVLDPSDPVQRFRFLCSIAMGKASRKKGERKDREASRARRSVSSFYARAGLSRSPMSNELVDYLFANHDPELVEALVQAIDGRSYWTDGRDVLPGDRLDPYPLIWATQEIARDTFGMAAPATEEWLVSLLGRGDLGPVVLDVGCGMGVQACFLAELHPAWSVTGLDRCTEGIQRARELAQQLEVANVDFQVASIEDLINMPAQTADSVLCSLVIVDWLIEELDRPTPDPWSVASSCHQLLEETEEPRLSGLAHVLGPDGRIGLLERCQTSPSAALLVGALDSVGLVVEEIGSLTFRDLTFEGGSQRLARVFAKKGEPQAANELWRVVGPLVWEWEPEELCLAEDPPIGRVVGSELEVEDEGGHGMTRLECFELESGALAVLMSTSRKFRDLKLYRADQAGEATELVRNWLADHENAPDVVSMRPLGDEPVPQSRPDLLKMCR